MLAKVMKSNLEQLLDLPKEVTEKVVLQSKNLSLQELVNIFTAVIAAQDMARKVDSYRIPLEVMVIKLAQKEESVNNAHRDTPRESFVGSAAKVVANKIKLNNSGSLFVEPKNKDANVKPLPDSIQQEVKVKELPKDNPKINTQNSAKEEPRDLPQIDFDTLANGWTQLIDSVSEKKMSVGTYLKDARPVRLEEGILTIGFSRNALFYKEAVEEKRNQKLITDKINDLFKTMIGLKFELLEDLDKLSAESNGENPENNSDNVFVKSVLDTFNGRLFKKG